MAEDNKLPKPKENIIPEVIERDHIRPIVEAHVAFATALTGVKHALKRIEMATDAEGRVKVPVEVTAHFGNQKMDYIVIDVPIIVPMPPGTLFEKPEDQS